MTDPVTLRYLDCNDAEKIYEWQSEPETRRYSNNKEIPGWEEHLAWVEKRITLYPDLTYIIEQGGKSLGLLHFYPNDEDELTISILVAPEEKGKGIAYEALCQAICLHRGRSILAQVHEENKVSKKLFLKAGFRLRGKVYVLENAGD